MSNLTANELLQWLKLNKYEHLRILKDGSIAGLTRLATTVGLFTGLSELSWERRYCYRDLRDALDALNELQSKNDVPEGWIARRPETKEDIAAKKKPGYVLTPYRKNQT